MWSKTTSLSRINRVWIGGVLETGPDLLDDDIRWPVRTATWVVTKSSSTPRRALPEGHHGEDLARPGIIERDERLPGCGDPSNRAP